MKALLFCLVSVIAYGQYSGTEVSLEKYRETMPVGPLPATVAVTWQEQLLTGMSPREAKCADSIFTNIDVKRVLAEFKKFGVNGFKLTLSRTYNKIFSGIGFSNVTLIKRSAGWNILSESTICNQMRDFSDVLNYDKAQSSPQEIAILLLSVDSICTNAANVLAPMLEELERVKRDSIWKLAYNHLNEAAGDNDACD